MHCKTTEVKASPYNHVADNYTKKELKERGRKSA